MPTSSRRLVGRTPSGGLQVGAGRAALVWLSAWLVGNVLGSMLLLGFGDGDSDEISISLTVGGALLLWAPFVAALVWVSRTEGTGDVLADYGARFEPIDLLGIPIGVLGQLVLIRLVYLPLEAIWPDVFSQDRLQENARDLWDRADGAWLLGLVLIVVVGAPLVEEFVYRGLLQGALVRRFDDIVAVVAVAAWFAVIHFRPVEYPGLFAIGLVFGVCALVTRRLTMSILAHVAFNAVGLALAAR